MLLRVALLFVGLTLSAGSGWAAEIYGQLWDDSQKPPIGAVVEASCGGSAPADEYGRYRLTDLPLRNNCTLVIHYRELQSNPVKIYTANNRNSANFLLKLSSGRLLLIRR